MSWERVTAQPCLTLEREGFHHEDYFTLVKYFPGQLDCSSSDSKTVHISRLVTFKWLCHSFIHPSNCNKPEKAKDWFASKIYLGDFWEDWPQRQIFRIFSQWPPVALLQYLSHQQDVVYRANPSSWGKRKLHPSCPCPR